MASSIKFVNANGRVHNTPISKCIYCRDKAPNDGYPYCNDCYKLRWASERPCCNCKKTIVKYMPEKKMQRIYCAECTEKYKAKKAANQVKFAIPQTKTFYEITHFEPEKQRLYKLFEGLTQLEITNIVYDMLEQKEQFIKRILNENDLLKIKLEQASK